MILFNKISIEKQQKNVFPKIMIGKDIFFLILSSQLFTFFISELDKFDLYKMANIALRVSLTRKINIRKQLVTTFDLQILY